MRPNDIDFSAIDYETLTPAQWNAVKQAALRRGRACRAEAIRAAVAGLRAWLRMTMARLRARRAAITALAGLDDRVLKDIGVRRCEIVSLVQWGGRDDTRLPRPVTQRAIWPPSRTSSARFHRSGSRSARAAG